MNWRLQKSKGCQETIFTRKGFEYWRIQNPEGSRETYTLSMNWRLQNPKGFRENIYTNMTSIKISSSVHGATTFWPDLRVLLDHWGSAHHVKVFEHGNLIIRESADFTLLIIGNPGALVTFFNYIPGLLFPKKIMQSQSGSITFRRVGFSICVHRWLSPTLIQQ